MKKLTSVFELLPKEVKSKCALCNETLTHIVKKAEAETGAGTATVTDILAGEINKGAAPGDVVSGGALRQRVLGHEGSISRNPTNSQPQGNGNPASTPDTQKFFSSFEYPIEMISRVESKYSFDEIYKRLQAKEYNTYRNSVKVVRDLLNRLEEREI
ncbi:MAG: hypothetical protein BBJ57_02375 [Desulfobacterales bacterium PC51MH44]|nr:MAG: hypothetical protein BBJ57_02375 [Desulfobacterales bacterium PC51MH44]